MWAKGGPVCGGSRRLVRALSTLRGYVELLGGWDCVCAPSPAVPAEDGSPVDRVPARRGRGVGGWSSRVASGFRKGHTSPPHGGDPVDERCEAAEAGEGEKPTQPQPPRISTLHPCGRAKTRRLP